MKRPDGVPPEATWSERDDAWTDGTLVKGRLHGEVRRYRRDGTLQEQTTYVHGVESGRYLRFHDNGEISQRGQCLDDARQGLCSWHRSTEPTRENTIPTHYGERVWTMEHMIQGPRIEWMRLTDREGHEVDTRGNRAPERPVGIPSTARFDDDGWVLGSFQANNGAKTGTWRQWFLDGTLQGELVYDDSEVVESRWFTEAGVLHEETAPGLERTFDKDSGRPLLEKRTLDGELVECREWAEEGHLVWQGERRDGALHWEELAPDGGLRSKGIQRKTWTAYDDQGTEIGTATAEELRWFSARERSMLRGLTQDIVALREVPLHPALAQVSDIAWDELETCFGVGSAIPHLLRGLAGSMPIRDRTRAELYDLLLHQGSVYPATTPTAWFMVRLIEAGVEDCDELAAVLHQFATDGDLGTARQNLQEKSVRTAEQAFDITRYTKGHYDESGPWFADLFAAIQTGSDTWVRWIQSGTEREQAFAARLLPIGLGRRDDAREALIAILADRSRLVPHVQIDLVLGSCLHPPSPNLFQALEGLTKAEEPWMRFAAAVARVRLEPTSAPEATLQTLLDAMADADPELEIYETAGWSTDVSTDASAAFGLVGKRASKVVDAILGSLASASSLRALAIVNAALAIVFPGGFDDDPLEPAQERALKAIVQCDAAWRFNANLHEILDHRGLPRSRAAVAEMVGLSAPEDDGILTATSAAPTFDFI